MKKKVYKIQCITNLHVGSGDVNFNVIDNEVEKDPITHLPMIHASGIKGALRDAIKNENKGDAFLNKIFGTSGSAESSNPGAYKFLDAYLISRPMRVYESDSIASIPVVTLQSVNQYLELLNDFDCNHYGIDRIETVDFGENLFLTNVSENILVEGEKTGKIEKNIEEKLLKLEDIIGTKFALARGYEDFGLPVVARNYLENGISKNLWYEEIVPHGSVFFFLVMAPDEDDCLEIPEIVQFGAHASIGRGFTKVELLL